MAQRRSTPQRPLGPVVHVDGSEIRIGTCSWTDPTLVKETDWYPKRSMSAAERLGFYAGRFAVVEADSTYYHPPADSLTEAWVERTPDGFVFDVKAYSLLTHHPTLPESLWPDLAEAVKPEFRGKRRLYDHHLDPDALAEAWARFGHALSPLARAGRLGGVLLQYPRWFTPKRANREELGRVRSLLGGLTVTVEFRSPAWLAASERDRTLATLRDAGLCLVVVDAPPVSGLDTVLAVTNPELAVVRFHGRADDTWDKRNVSAAERFRYLYDVDELRPWAARARELAAGAGQVHLLMNNCYQDYGVRNATDLERLLADEPLDGDGRDDPR